MKILRFQCVFLLLLVMGLGAAQAQERVFAGADPHALFIGEELWIFPTGGPGKPWGPNRLGAWSSSDMRHWHLRGEILDRKDIHWLSDDGARRHFLWAPSVLTRYGLWYLYYSIGPNSPTPSRIGVAVADNPEGPYTDSGEPLLTGGKGFEAIDPMVFIDPKDDTPYLYAGGSSGSTLRVFELNRDMVSIRREITIEQPPQFTEAPFMHERDGIYYLSYSHGRWKSPSYSVHYAMAPSPTGPWTYKGALLVSDARYQGPGHSSFVVDPKSGTWKIVYHRWEGPDEKRTFEGRRVIAMQPIRYAADGSIEPIVMTEDPARIASSR